ncbi:MAG: helix-turn-helix transcriptional regulator [Solobacterium sp.]|nr:helix-turn-helix transcriptional regulator [Solobacterium sp.]
MNSENENERLIRVACEAVRRFRSGRYSLPVYSAVYNIERHYHSELRIEEMAEHLGLSTPYFIRLFKKETQMTPNEYLVKYRLKIAADLLQNSNFSISQISSEVGFQDSNYFTRCFRKQYQVTPTQYRNFSGQKTK